MRAAIATKASSSLPCERPRSPRSPDKREIANKALRASGDKDRDRAQTKGKVERFIRYLKHSFWVPFVASMRQAGLKPDKHVANGVNGPGNLLTLGRAIFPTWRGRRSAV